MATSTSQASQEQELLLIAQALLAAGTVAGLASVIAEVLSVGLPVATRVAEIAIQDVPEVRSSGFLRQVEEEEVIYRAAYIRQASTRLRETGDRGAADDAERHYFDLHRQQAIRRLEGGERTAQAISVYGDVLGWYAQIRPTSRPNHRLAHRQNFRPTLGPPVLTQAYPGVLNHCLCEVGPPTPGAQEFH